MYLSQSELGDLGLGAVGENVLIDKTAAIFGAGDIHIGDNVRIDCFVVLTAGPKELRIGQNVHIAAGVQIFGGGGVFLDDFTGLSGRVSIHSVNDDYSHGYLTNPTVPEKFRNVTAASVHLARHALVGAGSVVLPGVLVGKGASVGALSLVNKSIPEFTIVAGNPLRRIGTRDEARLGELEDAYLGEGKRRQGTP